MPRSFRRVGTTPGFAQSSPHYEDQTEDEQFAEIEAAQDAQDVTMVAVPTELVPEVTALIAERWSTSGDRVPTP